MFSLVLGNGVPGVRRACTLTMTGLAVQFCVGMVVNLYVTVPAADARASWLKEVETAPAFLTVHALLGLALLGAGTVLVIRAVSAGRRILVAASALGLIALLGAFTAGEIFVKNGQYAASLWMAILTGVALLCYIAVQHAAAQATVTVPGGAERNARIRAGHRIDHPAAQ